MLILVIDGYPYYNEPYYNYNDPYHHHYGRRKYYFI
jgi:hypothetical protein